VVRTFYFTQLNCDFRMNLPGSHLFFYPFLLLWNLTYEWLALCFLFKRPGINFMHLPCLSRWMLLSVIWNNEYQGRFLYVFPNLLFTKHSKIWRFFLYSDHKRFSCTGMKTTYYETFLHSSPEYFVAIKKLRQQSIVYSCVAPVTTAKA
jgi:hypothetical protein